jgi:hypothetical protein
MQERELCVFFRNNHFNTMFRFEGQLYILVTDQGYLHQPGLVWEKLSAVRPLCICSSVVILVMILAVINSWMSRHSACDALATLLVLLSAISIWRIRQSL